MCKYLFFNRKNYLKRNKKHEFGLTGMKNGCNDENDT